MSTRYYIGFDNGTMGTKVAVFTADGMLVSEAYREHAILYPKPGWAEMDPDQFYRVVIDGIKECVTKAKIDPGAVHGISCSGIICGFVPIDEHWRPLGAYIPYLDGRAQKEARELQAIEDPAWAAESGNGEAGAYMPPVIIKWVLANQPDIKKNVKKVVSAAHYVMGKLGGLQAKDAFIDWAHQSGWVIGFDAAKRDWSAKQIDQIGLPYEILPRVTKPWEVIGQLTKEQADLMGLKPGVPLVAGAGDIMQSCLGSGLTDVGMSFDVAGTASIAVFAVDRLDPEITKKKVLISAMNTFDDQYLYWSFIPAGGLSLRWYRDELLRMPSNDAVYRDLDALAAKVPTGSEFALFFPFLQGRSSPFWPTASGAWLGLRAGHSSGHMWRSLMESISYEYLMWATQVRDAKLPLSQMIGAGGGSKSRIWNQIKADMMNVEYMIPSHSEGAVMGNALLAAYGVGDVKDMKQTIKEWVKFKEVFKPRKEYTDFYRKAAEIRAEILNGPLLECFNRVQALHDLVPPQA